MSGRLIILPHKSWNVWGRENKEKVARDERLAKEADEREAKERVNREQTLRLDKLRRKRRDGGEDGGEEAIEEEVVVLDEEEKRRSHLNFYKEPDKYEKQMKRKSKWDEDEGEVKRREDGEKMPSWMENVSERDIWGRGGVVGSTPWYVGRDQDKDTNDDGSSGGQRRGKIAKREVEEDHMMRDPMYSFISKEDQEEEEKDDHKRRKKKKNKHKKKKKKKRGKSDKKKRRSRSSESEDNDDEIARLRRVRMRREIEERRRAKDLMSNYNT